jgi:tetratricopeptide (TPR) repeat protein
MKYALLQALRFVVIAGAIMAAVYALVLARASRLFQEDTAVSVAAAVRVQPHNALYLDRLASWQPDERESLLKRSLAENPFNYEAWIRLGLMAEMQAGDDSTAEQDYLKAAEVDHMFLPRWTLTNFYFRQNRPAPFFHWTKKTLEVTPYASDAVFAQMWQMTQDEDKLEAAIPDRTRILLQYAWYLSNHKQFDSIPTAVERLVKAVGKDDPSKWGLNDLVAASEDHMLAEGYMRPALTVWSTLHAFGWLKHTVPNDQKPLTNGRFEVPFYRHGFDWVSPDNPGTRVEHFPDVPEVRMNLNGDEGEHITLLQQYVDLAPDTRYTMTWKVQSEELNQPSGLAWHVHPVKGGGTAGGASGDLVGSPASWTFVSPIANAYLLTLEYIRPLGSTRARGALTLKSVTMNQK